MPELAGLTYAIRPARADPEGAIVLLHGRGTSEYDLAPLLDELDPGRRLAGVTPRGPLALPPGGAHWYVVRRVGYPDPGTFFPALALLRDFVDALPEALGIPDERTVIGGFSQGAVMSYAVALGAGRARPAGIIALSGFIPTADGLELDFDGLQGFPAAVGHGTYDPIIDVSFGRAARDRLLAAGADVSWRESPIGHAVDPSYIDELVEWLPGAVSLRD